MYLNEAKATFTLPELVAGTREVNVEIDRAAKAQPCPIEGLRAEEAALMKQLKWTATVNGNTSVITLYDHAKKEKPTSGLAAMAAAVLSGGQYTDKDTQPVRVACTCGEYLAVFSAANYAADAHHGYRPRAADPRDYGYKNKVVNEGEIPGRCRHLICLYYHLKRTGRLQ